MSLEGTYKGSKFTLIHCDGALDSLTDALKHIPKATRKASMERSIVFQIRRLIDGHPMSAANFPMEGELPNKQKFSALKKIPLRGYTWKSTKHPNTYFVSHYVYKNYDDLRDSDTALVCENWHKIED